MKSIAPVVLLALALFAAGSAWWMTSSVREPERVALPAIEPHSAETLGNDAAGFDALPAEARADVKQTREVERPAPPAILAAPQAFEPPPDARAIDGRVVLPPGVPLDEELSVVARGGLFENRERTCTARVGADGRFRAHFARSTRTGTLELEARYLLLDERPRLLVREHEGELVLEPTLGGRVHGRVALPPSRAGEDLDDDRARVLVFMESGGGSAACDAEGRFELGPLRPTSSGTLRAQSTRWAESRIAGIEVRAGEVTHVELELQRGVALLGRVVDAKGDGLAGVQVGITGLNSVGRAQDMLLKSTDSDADGRFELRGIPPGEIRLSARLPAYPPVVESLGELVEGQVREGLLLRMGRGAALAGVVRWPDGRPAAGASVALSQPALETERQLPHETRLADYADDEGRFHFEGLGSEPCELRARALPDDRDASTNALRPASWEARRFDLRPGAQDVELVLSEGVGVRGRARDDAGARLERFTIFVEPLKVPGALASPASQGFDSDDGRFELRGLSEGRWRIRAKARGYVSSEPQELDVPAESSVELVVTRCGRIAGRVLAPDGEPIDGAMVYARACEGANTDVRVPNAGDLAKSVRGGEFSERRAEPGRFALVARREGFAASEPVDVELTPGSELTGIELRLRREARIEGRVSAAAGDVERRTIRAVSDAGKTQRARSDARGEFAIGGLASGRYRVILEPAPGDLAFGGVGLSSNYETQVELALGETERVVLPAEPPGAIVVEGRVTAGGAPVPGLAIGWRSPRTHFNTGARTDAEGIYRVALDGSGAWQVTVHDAGDPLLSEEIHVPAARPLRHDVALPTGRISGTVRDDSGRGIGRAWVRTRASAASAPSSIQLRNQLTDEEGRYAFEHVPAGRVHLTADESNSGYAQGALWLDLAEGEHRERADLVLAPGGTIAGRVLDASGRPVTGARVEARDHADGSRDTLSLGSDGRFSLDSLGVGDHAVRAERNGIAGPVRNVRVEAGRVTSVELVLPD